MVVVQHQMFADCLTAREDSPQDCAAHDQRLGRVEAAAAILQRPVGVDQLAAGEAGIRVCIHEIDERIDAAFAQHDVGIQDENVLGPRGLDALVDRNRVAEVVAVGHDTHVRKLLLQHCGGTVA
jgi:hypothetical protein